MDFFATLAIGLFFVCLGIFIDIVLNSAKAIDVILRGKCPPHQKSYYDSIIELKDELDDLYVDLSWANEDSEEKTIIKSKITLREGLLEELLKKDTNQ
jgi:hypothetical protein